MTIQGFHPSDFEVFTIEGLEPRMEAIKASVRPKLEAIGQEIEPFLSIMTGDEMFAHVAKHLRRSVNPPNDTWVAWANNKRGYKAYPHFQTGLWHSHLFIQFAIIYESTHKTVFAENFKKNFDELIEKVPGHFVWSIDHTKPEAVAMKDINEEQMMQMLDRLIKVKKAEITCGIHLKPTDPVVADGQQLVETIQQTFETLMPLYRAGFQSE